MLKAITKKSEVWTVHTVFCIWAIEWFALSVLAAGLVGYTMRDIRYKWNSGSKSVGISNEVELPQFRVLGHRQRATVITLTTGKRKTVHPYVSHAPVFLFFFRPVSFLYDWKNGCGAWPFRSWHWLVIAVGYTMRDIRYKWNEGPNSVGVSNEVSLPQFKVLGHRQRAMEISLTTGTLYGKMVK